MVAPWNQVILSVENMKAMLMVARTPEAETSPKKFKPIDFPEIQAATIKSGARYRQTSSDDLIMSCVADLMREVKATRV